MISNDGFLFIEPGGAPTAPIIDDITRAATALLRSATTGSVRYRGQHQCTGRGCNAMSDNADHYICYGKLTSKIVTHSLIVHYVACHRDEVPADALLYLGTLTALAESTQHELTGVRTRETRDGSKVMR